MMKLLLFAALLAALAGCGAADDVRDKVDTVDQGTALLDEIDQNGTWEALHDGLGALHELDEGVTARAALEGSDQRDFTLEWQADGTGIILANLSMEGVSGSYLVVNADAAIPAGVYRISEDRYACEDGPAADLLAPAMTGLLDRLSSSAAGMGLLSVIDDPDDVTMFDREATRYAIVSKVQDALDVLDAFENDGLAEAVAQAGAFSLEGTLTIDDATGALLEADSVYTPEGAGAVHFSLEVTQWGVGDAITLPDAAQISEACAEP